MFEHFWPKIDGFWQHNDKPTDATHPEPTAQPDHENEFRCWNCGEYIDVSETLVRTLRPSQRSARNVHVLTCWITR